MVRFLCQFQQVDVNLGPGCKKLTLDRRFLPFKPPDTLTTLESTQNPVPAWPQFLSILIGTTPGVKTRATQIALLISCSW
ncbi:unnamed protein product [Sphagnum jensenii]|uniref:Uncharacterized protein n=1 Tax=Sphagnum jensenii TaxID=128206 RepID=A0ABP0WBJ7_9BRYO